MDTNPSPAGWYGDPFRQLKRHRLRYWDGRAWTQWVVDDVEPYVERERPCSFDRSALRHPFWTSAAYGVFVVLAFVATTGLLLRGQSDIRSLVGSATLFAAIMVPYNVFMTRRRLQKPPQV